MERVRISKKIVIGEIEHLSNSYLMDVYTFIQYLKFKQLSTVIRESERSVLHPEADPLLDACGLVDVAPFSHKIDETLYGDL